MNEKTACIGHNWNITENEFVEMTTSWNKNNDAPEGNFYVSKYAVHYWYTAKCKNCGESKLFSSVFDRNGTEKISDEEFMWLTLFITQLNCETGYIEQKKALINDSLDQMHWEHFPYATFHNPLENYFSITYKQNRFLSYDWNFDDAVRMFSEMNERAVEYLEPEAVDHLKQKLDRLEELKRQYRTLMELSTQAGVDGTLQAELDKLAAEFKKLSAELKDLM